MQLTKGCWKCPEDEAISILEEAHPLHTVLLPLFDQACAVKKSMNIAVAMRLALDYIRVILFQSQVSIIVRQACDLPQHCLCKWPFDVKQPKQ